MASLAQTNSIIQSFSSSSDYLSNQNEMFISIYSAQHFGGRLC